MADAGDPLPSPGCVAAPAPQGSLQLEERLSDRKHKENGEEATWMTHPGPDWCQGVRGPGGSGETQSNPRGAWTGEPADLLVEQRGGGRGGNPNIQGLSSGRDGACLTGAEGSVGGGARGGRREVWLWTHLACELGTPKCCAE